ncbi:hypothetical protein CH333_09260 [candidate division WOR-3 bacterium JGI_Cruoil_03_44_89]|uniref:Addiction module toxin, HicA family n=1 Tax=candidate division WOR-3 bacterium JGI_Cruoil_03_44_89 TaxID=1973748 RepID=A0A235BNU9_UNCW3|nr:MAG: hypothetical protein CH333_09260 [candidate division WOR-3 bacterium JGI_Cruoil_03_44_89]
MKLPIVSSEDVVRVLKRVGFSYAPKRGKGSHLAFYKKDQDRKRLVIIPKRKAIPKGTLLAILEQAGLTREQFLELLRR